MKLKQRETIFNKYGGRCAYCGEPLRKAWHVDELLPIHRKYKYDCLENQMPACASCNINKHRLSLEEFRALIWGFVRSLNRDSTQYKVARRYGLIVEAVKPIVFYFEHYAPEPTTLAEQPASDVEPSYKDVSLPSLIL